MDLLQSKSDLSATVEAMDEVAAAAAAAAAVVGRLVLLPLLLLVVAITVAVVPEFIFLFFGRIIGHIDHLGRGTRDLAKKKLSLNNNT